ncbi:MAG TPA: hypothetical protein VIG53_00395, partial [Actinomycetota bacterium]
GTGPSLPRRCSQSLCLKEAPRIRPRLERGRITPELTAALHDPVVDAAHIYELAIVTVVILLMVTKPF